MRLKNKTLLITGIGGFIGMRAAEIAAGRGMRVRGIELDPERARLVEERIPGATVFQGDGTDPAVVGPALKGADVVLHTAAIVKEGGSLEEFRRVNVSGTRVLAAAAREAGARVFLHLSSVMVYGFDYPDRVTEDGPFRGENNPYCITKIESESALTELHEPGVFDVVIVRPGDVYGPGSGPWVSRPLDLMRRRMFALVDGGKGVINHVYVDNLIDGILLAVEGSKQAGGLAFNITDGQATTWREYFTRLARIGGMPAPFAVPGWLMKAAVRLMNLARALVGKGPEVLPEGVDFVRRPHAVSIERAREILGYAPAVLLEEGLERTAVWLREERGKVNARVACRGSLILRTLTCLCLLSVNACIFRLYNGRQYLPVQKSFRSGALEFQVERIDEAESVNYDSSSFERKLKIAKAERKIYIHMNVFNHAKKYLYFGLWEIKEEDRTEKMSFKVLHTLTNDGIHDKYFNEPALFDKSSYPGKRLKVHMKATDPLVVRSHDPVFSAGGEFLAHCLQAESRGVGAFEHEPATWVPPGESKKYVIICEVPPSVRLTRIEFGGRGIRLQGPVYREDLRGLFKRREKK